MPNFGVKEPNGTISTYPFFELLVPREKMWITRIIYVVITKESCARLSICLISTCLYSTI